MSEFSITSLFPSFHSGGMDKKEFESMINEAVKKEYPNNNIKNIKYLSSGIEIILDNNETIEVEIDWNELIIG